MTRDRVVSIRLTDPGVYGAAAHGQAERGFAMWMDGTVGQMWPALETR